jgi:hypothetical protein
MANVYGPIDLSPIITRLRAQMPSAVIGGAVEYAVVKRLPPALASYVVPSSEFHTVSNQSMRNSAKTEVSFDVVTCFQAIEGQSFEALESIVSARLQAVSAALLGWKIPGDTVYAIDPAGSKLLATDDQTLWMQQSFKMYYHQIWTKQ